VAGRSKSALASLIASLVGAAPWIFSLIMEVINKDVMSPLGTLIVLIVLIAILAPVTG
jgi:hypothetical protein